MRGPAERLLSRWDVVREWISECNSTHYKYCAPQETLLISDLQVIDCRTYEVVALPAGHQYITLSYIWGTMPADTAPEPSPSTALPTHAPRVVKDAVDATSELGFRYLWVDRHCISRADHGKMRDQLNKMGNIYAASYLTIIASAGEGPNDGLFWGRDMDARVPQQSQGVADDIAGSCCKESEFEIRHSKWNTRGWTYQEALLSHRRLVFGMTQIYFQCQTGSRFECHKVTDSAKLFPPLRRPRSVRQDIRDLSSLVQEYVARDLSHESDGLDAFRGILEVYGRLRTPIRHFHGVLLYPDCWFTDWEAERLYPATSLDALLCGLTWHFSGRMQRREALPSWSWAGWKSQARPNQFKVFGLDREEVGDDASLFPPLVREVSISVEFKSGKVRSWIEERTSQENLHFINDTCEADDSPAYLLLSCAVLRVTIHCVVARRFVGCQFEVTSAALESGAQRNLTSACFVLAGHDGDEPEEEQEVKALVVGFWTPKSHALSGVSRRIARLRGPTWIILLLVREVYGEAGSWHERIGCVLAWDDGQNSFRRDPDRRILGCGEPFEPLARETIRLG